MSNNCVSGRGQAQDGTLQVIISPDTKSEDEIRRILVLYNRDKRNMPWLSKVPVDGLTFCNILSVQTAAYCLQTMWETRNLVKKLEPSPPPTSVAFRPAGNAALNSPVSLWNIKITSAQFAAGKRSVEIPGDSLVVACEKCVGSGKMRCGTCNGQGKVECKKCSERVQQGTAYRKMCRNCNETGTVACSSCERGKVICKDCRGLKYMRETSWVEVEWSVVTGNPVFVKDDSLNWDAIDLKELKNVAGKSKDVFFSNDSSPGEWRDRMTCATDLIRKVDRLGRDERQLQLREQSETKKVIAFRQTMKTIPISEVVVEYQSEEIGFFLLGNENQICWGDGFPDIFGTGDCCTIM